VVTDRALIGEPWRRYRAPAWNLFIFRLVLAIVIWFVVIGIAVAGVMIAWPDVTGGDFGINSMVALAVGVPAILAAVLIVMLITIALNDFVVPIMALRGMDSVMPALRVFASEILGVAPGTCLLYVLMRFILGIALSLLVLVLGCMTCCIGFCVFALPYVGTVVRLPIAYFFRSYPLYFIEQFGPQWRIFPAAAAASAAPPEPASPPVRGI
jgi:hypothetical protein